MKGFLPVPNPIAFTVFGLGIRWYAIMIVLGMAAAVFLSYKRAHLYGIKPADKVIDFVLWVIPAGVIGARLYYVVYSWDMYKGDIAAIINIREGGLAIHGGLIFGILAAIVVTRVWKHSIISWLDLAAPAIALAQSIGRWGNYFNSEAHGGPTNLPWAILVEENGQQMLVHPTFLYESLWCLLLALFLLYLERKHKTSYRGQLMILYGILYSVERFFVEGLRTDSLMVGPLRQAQVISIAIIIGCIILGFVFRRLSKKAKA